MSPPHSRGPALGRGDLLRLAVRDGHAAFERALDRLGYVRELAPDRPGGLSLEGAPIKAPTPGEETRSATLPTTFLRVRAVQFHDAPEVQSQRRTTSLPPWSSRAILRPEALVPNASSPTSAPSRRWPDWAGALHRALAGADALGRLDLEAAVERAARLDPLEPIPRRPSPGLTGRLWVLVDRRVTLAPIWTEQEIVLSGLLHTYGTRRIVPLALPDGPRSQETQLLHSEAVSGDAVLAVGEVAGAEGAWAALGRAVRGRLPLRVWTSVVGRRAPMEWRGAALGGGEDVSPDAVEALLARLAYASTFDADHLRLAAEALGLGLAHALAVWRHPDVRVGLDARAYFVRNLDEHRARFRALRPEAQNRALEQLGAARRAREPELFAEELASLRGDDVSLEGLPADVLRAGERYFLRLERAVTEGQLDRRTQQSLRGWLRRLDERVDPNAFGRRDDVGQALQRLWWSACREDRPVPPGLDLSLVADLELGRTPERFQLGVGPEGLAVDDEAASWLYEVESGDGAVSLPAWRPSWAVEAGFDAFGRWADFEVGGVRQRMRWCPPGTFRMGSPEDDEEALDSERPAHHVTLTDGFWLGDTPCTQSLWEAVMRVNPSHFHGGEHPVEKVSHDDVEAFLERLDGLREEAGEEPLGLVLPTEAQWEYACRAGSLAPRYGELDAVAWYDENGGNETHAVKAKAPNAWGFYDLLGNVWEWCRDGATREGDEYVGRPYAEREVHDPFLPPEERPWRVVRGGSWIHPARYVRAAFRGALVRGDRSDGSLGFRVSRGPAQRVGRAEPDRGSSASAEPSPPARTSERRRASEGPTPVLLRSGTRIPIDLQSPTVLQTDRMTLELEPFARPEWAHGLGRDRFGLYADVEVAPKAKSLLPVRFRMRWIPPGRFRMGSPPQELGRHDDEGPQHLVTLTRGSWLADTPCTQALWAAVLGPDAQPSEFKHPQRPVESVSFDDVEAFLEALSAVLPGARLPTEAEWEYACRAGAEAATHVGGLQNNQTAPILDAIAWYGANSDQGVEGESGQTTALDAGTHRVGLKAPNSWGAYDMLGNVNEWCADGAGGEEDLVAKGRAYADQPAVDPFQAPDGRPLRVVRGGSWRNSAWSVRAAYRFAFDRDARRDSLGFRVSRGPAE